MSSAQIFAVAVGGRVQQTFRSYEQAKSYARRLPDSRSSIKIIKLKVSATEVR